MHWQKPSFVVLVAAVVCSLLTSGQTVAQSWQTAQLLNDPSEAGQDIKNAKVRAAKNGGFHAVYQGGQVRYRRYVGGVLKPMQTMPIGNFYANVNMCESLDGRVHVVIEDWAGDAPETRWYRYDVNDATGGLFNGLTQYISASNHTAKHPHIVPFGTGTSSEVVMSYCRMGDQAPDNTDKWLFSSRYNGASWAIDLSLGSSGNSEYEVFGMARSPVDGTVYRAFTEGGVLKMRRFRSGYFWDPVITVDNVTRNLETMHVRQRVAVNDAGQVMVLWEQASKYYTVIYTPGIGLGSVTMVTDQGSWGTSLCSIPGTNNFYTAYSKGSNHVIGRRWNGSWGAEEEISVGQAWDFTVGPDVSAGADGSIYAVWEYWGTDKPQQWYSVKPAPSPGSTGTISGTVFDQYGQAVGGIGITTNGAVAAGTGTGGTYSMNLPAGTYTLNAAQEYFSNQTKPSIVVSAGQTTTVNFNLVAQYPSPVTSLTATFGSTKNTLQWVNPSSANLYATRVVYKTGSAPTGPNDGTVLIEDGGAPGSTRSFVHTGLSNGTTYYYAAWAYMLHGNRYYASSAPTASGTPAIRPDMDHDADVDQDDFGLFQKCLSGTNIAQTDPACQQAKLDGDTDVDADDIALFISCKSGAGVPAGTTCVP